MKLKDYSNLKEMLIDFNEYSTDYTKTRCRELEETIKNTLKEIERLNKKMEQYENPEDMTLMFMWCDEKAKDEIKRLNNIINELEKYLEKIIIDGGTRGSMTFWYRQIYDYLQELKGEDKE